MHCTWTLSVKCYFKTFCFNPWMMTSPVELQQFYLLGLTRSAEFVGQRRSRTSTFYTLAERHGASLIVYVSSLYVVILSNLDDFSFSFLLRKVFVLHICRACQLPLLFHWCILTSGIFLPTPTCPSTN